MSGRGDTRHARSVVAAGVWCVEGCLCWGVLFDVGERLAVLDAVVAVAVDVERVVRDLEFLLLRGFLDVLGYLGVWDFGDGAAGEADEVVVGFGVVGPLVLRLVFAELEFDDESALHEEVDGVV